MPFIAYSSAGNARAWRHSVAWTVANSPRITAASPNGRCRRRKKCGAITRTPGIASGIAYQQGRGVPVDGGLVLSGGVEFFVQNGHSE